LVNTFTFNLQGKYFVRNAARKSISLLAKDFASIVSRQQLQLALALLGQNFAKHT
jgi:hypothetical protein